MTKIIFLVEEDYKGGFFATALEESIFTGGETYDEIKTNVKEAVSCHFDEDKKPKLIRLHFVKDEVFLA